VTLKLLSYNIRFGGRGREQPLAETISAIDPDLVVFQEAIYPDVIERLATQTGLPFWAARRHHSIGFISKHKIAYHEWHYPAGARHSFLEIVPENSETRVFGLHLSARFSKWDERRRAREIRSLIEGIKRHQNGFHVLVGDFNTLAPGETLDLRKLPPRVRAFVYVTGRTIRWETIQIMLDASYVDGYRALHPKDPGLTFPAGDPHVRLDFVFLPSAFAPRLRSCAVVNGTPETRSASDHLPLVADLDLD